MSEQNKTPEALSDAWWERQRSDDQRYSPPTIYMLRQTQRKEIEARIAELESPAPVQSPCGTCGNHWNQCECGDAPEQERRKGERRCNHAWRGKTPKCKWGKCTWVPFDGRIIRAYVDRRKSRPKPSASVEEIVNELAPQIDIAHISCVNDGTWPHREALEHLIAAAITEATTPLEVEVARLRELLQLAVKALKWWRGPQDIYPNPDLGDAFDEQVSAALKGDE